MSWSGERAGREGRGYPSGGVEKAVIQVGWG